MALFISEKAIVSFCYLDVVSPSYFIDEEKGVLVPAIRLANKNVILLTNIMANGLGSIPVKNIPSGAGRS